MKIGYIITGLGTGGAENHLLKFLPNLKHNKFIISLTKNNSIGKLIQKKGIKVYYLNMTLLNLPSQIIKLFKILKKEKPDILDSYLIHSNLLTRFISKFMKIPNINSVRNDYSYSKIYTFADRITSPLVNVYAPNSKALLSYLKKIKINQSKIIILNNIIDESEFKNLKNLRKTYNIKKSSKVFISVARFVKQKNHKMIIESFQDYNRNEKNSFLFLLGDGKLLKEYKKKYKSKNIIFTGSVDNVKDFLYSSDTFILASSREGMSNALLEAMYLGLNCIVSNIPQNTELIKNNSGFVFKNKLELIRLMNSKKHRGKFAHKTIIEKYLPYTLYKKYNRLINKVTK